MSRPDLSVPEALALMQAAQHLRDACVLVLADEENGYRLRPEVAALVRAVLERAKPLPESRARPALNLVPR